MTKELNEKICEDNCELCDTNNINICVTCKYSFNIENDKKICLNKPNDDERSDENTITNNINEIINQDNNTNINNKSNEFLEECSSKGFLNNSCKINTNNTINKDNLLKNIKNDIENHLLDSLI